MCPLPKTGKQAENCKNNHLFSAVCFTLVRSSSDPWFGEAESECRALKLVSWVFKVYNKMLWIPITEMPSSNPFKYKWKISSLIINIWECVYSCVTVDLQSRVVCYCFTLKSFCGLLAPVITQRRKCVEEAEDHPELCPWRVSAVPDFCALSCFSGVALGPFHCSPRFVFSDTLERWSFHPGRVTRMGGIWGWF